MIASFSFACFSVIVFILWLVGYQLNNVDGIIGLFSFIPSPVVLLLITISVFLVWRARYQKKYWMLLLVCSIFPAYQTLLVENSWFAKAKKLGGDTQQDIGLVHWNVAWGKYNIQQVSKVLFNKPVAIYAISEPPRDNQLHDFTKLLGKEYTYKFRYKLLLATKGEILNSNWLLSKPGVMVWHHKIRLNGRLLTLFLVDIRSDPFYPRYPAIMYLKKIIKKHKPDIVVGDLNTSRRFIKQLKLPHGYQDAYDAVGRGWSYTWPTILPVLALDQTIFANTITPVSYQLTTYMGSDHRLQEFRFKFSDI